MSKTLNVLIVDDHPVIIDVFKSALNNLNKNFKDVAFKISDASNCDEALLKIDYAMERAPLDLVFLDIRLPSSKKRGIVSGEDLGEKIRVVFPRAKIIVLTSHNEHYRLNSIFNSINPEGFMVKTDVSFNEITNAIETVLSDVPYYSETILKLMRKQISNGIFIDKIDRQMLYELSIGTKTKNLPEVIPLSIAGIERRKRLLKKVFNVAENDDKVLIESAKENGFL